MRASISPRGRGTWRIRYDAGVRPDGRRKQGSLTVHGTKREAEAERARILHELNTGSFIDPSKTTLSQFLELYLEKFAGQRCAPKTLETYGDFVRKHLGPAIGHVKLSALRPMHLQEYYAAALVSGRRDGKGGLSPRSVLHQHRFLRAALQRALKLQLIPRNPADATDPPQPGDEVKEPSVLTEEETVRLLVEAESTPLFIPIVLGAALGIRRGEALGVRWKDIDLDRQTLAVRQTVSRASGRLFLKPPKTKKTRVETLPDCVIPILRRHKAEQAQLRLLAGPAWTDLDLVNPTADGNLWNPNAFTHQFERLAARLHLPITFHGLRHTHATALLDRGEDLKAVSDRLGHSSMKTTSDIYAHKMLKRQREVAGVVDEMLRPAFEPQTPGFRQSVTNP